MTYIALLVLFTMIISGQLSNPATTNDFQSLHDRHRSVNLFLNVIISQREVKELSYDARCNALYPDELSMRTQHAVRFARLGKQDTDYCMLYSKEHVFKVGKVGYCLNFS